MRQSEEHERPQVSILNWNLLADMYVHEPAHYYADVVITCHVLGDSVQCTKINGENFLERRIPTNEDPLGPWLWNDVRSSLESRGRLRLVKPNGEIVHEECAVSSMGPLALKRRKPLIMNKLGSVDADIVTLQEVEVGVFRDWLHVEMGLLGYEGVFQQKKRDPEFHRGKYTMEGCATFYKTHRFKEIDKLVLNYDKMTMEHRERLTGRSSNRLSKGNVGLALMLEDLQVVQSDDPTGSISQGCGRLLCVANTDLLEYRGQPDVKFWQAYLLMNALGQIPDENCSVLVCGGFNSVPESAVVEFLQEGSVCSNHRHLHEDPCDLKSMNLQHTLQLASVFERRNESTANYTKCAKDQNWILDYIWFSCKTLSLVGVASMDCEFEEAPDAQQIADLIRRLTKERDMLCSFAKEDLTDDDDLYYALDLILNRIPSLLGEARRLSKGNGDMEDVLSELLNIVEPALATIRGNGSSCNFDVADFLEHVTDNEVWQRLLHLLDRPSHPIRTDIRDGENLWPSDHIALVATFSFGDWQDGRSSLQSPAVESADSLGASSSCAYVSTPPISNGTATP